MLTMVLTVIGAFIPFFTGLEAAQLVAGLAVLIIVWLYWTEAKDVLAKKVNPKGLALPGAAILIIAAVAIVATIKVGSQARPPAALTMADISSAIDKAVQQNRAPQTIEREVPVDRNVTYRMVVDEPKISAPATITPPTKAQLTKSEDLTEDIRKKINRMRAGSKEKTECDSKIYAVKMKLTVLDMQSVNMRNAYAYKNDDKKMVADLSQWLKNVEEVFSENKEILPEFTTIQLANSETRVNTFLGIHNAGYKAWLAMEAKAKALATVQNSLNYDSCEQIRRLAVAECVEKGQC